MQDSFVSRQNHSVPNETCNEEYKIALVGCKGVGKTVFNYQYIQNVFLEEYDNTMEEYNRKRFQVDDKMCIVDIFEIVDDVEYKAMRDQFTRCANGFLIMFDVTSRKSFDKLNECVEEVIRVKDVDQFPMCLIGNKCDLDLERVVSCEEAKNFAKDIGIPYLEVSTKLRTNVDESFNEIVREIRKYNEKHSAPSSRQNTVKKVGCLLA
jgi:GTPase KRas protein